MIEQDMCGDYAHNAWVVDCKTTRLHKAVHTSWTLEMYRTTECLILCSLTLHCAPSQNHFPNETDLRMCPSTKYQLISGSAVLLLL